MKTLLAFSLISSSIFLCNNSAKADWDFWGILENNLGSPYYVGPSGTVNELKIYTIDSSSGVATFRNSICPHKRYDNPYSRWTCTVGSDHFVDQNGNLAIEGSGVYHLYNPDTNTFTEINPPWSDSYDKTFKRPIGRIDEEGNKILEISGSKIIEEKSDGSVHIGQNSAVFKEENGREKFWAQDANGKSIPIDITNGSKLLINGRDVEQSINNVGALSAALTGLPTVPTDTTLACGLGTGTHGGDFAFSGGCASKVNDKLSINYAASMTMPGQNYAGDFEDTFSARAGFVWKLGKSVKPTLISMKETEKMEEKIYSLEESNKKIISQNTDLKQKNQSIISQNKALLARLERLEKIAFGESKSKDLATIKLP